LSPGVGREERLNGVGTIVHIGGSRASLGDRGNRKTSRGMKREVKEGGRGGRRRNGRGRKRGRERGNCKILKAF
jgi:hypothetical protein